MRYYLLPMLITLLSLCACDSKEGECDDAPDFSPTSIVFDNNAISKTLKASNRVNWEFAYFYINGKAIDRSTLTYRYRDGMPRDSKNISEVEGSWFILKKIDDRTIEVYIINPFVTETLSFTISDGTCFQEIRVSNM